MVNHQLGEGFSDNDTPPEKKENEPAVDAVSEESATARKVVREEAAKEDHTEAITDIADQFYPEVTTPEPEPAPIHTCELPEDYVPPLPKRYYKKRTITASAEVTDKNGNTHKVERTFLVIEPLIANEDSSNPELEDASITEKTTPANEVTINYHQATSAAFGEGDTEAMNEFYTARGIIEPGSEMPEGVDGTTTLSRTTVYTTGLGTAQGDDLSAEVVTALTKDLHRQLDEEGKDVVQHTFASRGGRFLKDPDFRAEILKQGGQVAFLDPAFVNRDAMAALFESGIPIKGMFTGIGSRRSFMSLLRLGFFDSQFPDCEYIHDEHNRVIGFRSIISDTFVIAPEHMRTQVNHHTDAPRFMAQIQSQHASEITSSEFHPGRGPKLKKMVFTQEFPEDSSPIIRMTINEDKPESIESEPTEEMDLGEMVITAPRPTETVPQLAKRARAKKKPTVTFLSNKDQQTASQLLNPKGPKGKELKRTFPKGKWLKRKKAEPTQSPIGFVAPGEFGIINLPDSSEPTTSEQKEIAQQLHNPDADHINFRGEEIAFERTEIA